MLVVSDTSPINYLILIDCIDLLPRLFGRIVIPLTVLGELTEPDSPAVVKSWLSKPPDWLEARSPRPVEDSLLPDLDTGERDAILLARELGADALLADDYAAYERAGKEGIRVVRTLAILRLGAKRGWIDLPRAIVLLQKTNFRIRLNIVEELLAEDSKS